MASTNKEYSFEGLMDEPEKNPRVKLYEGLLKTIERNRCALKEERRVQEAKRLSREGVGRYASEIVRAMDAKDKMRVDSMISDAKKAGFDTEELKLACKEIRWKRGR
jgi:hypothetical protein